MFLSFANLMNNYPKDDDPETVKKIIGGKVDASWIKNTCAVRLSRALNYAGCPIPAHHNGLEVVSGADRKHYAFRMQELKRWLWLRLGAPTIDRHKPMKTLISRADFATHKGIIGFDIHFKDAEGHLDLWDGSTFIHDHVAIAHGQDYFALARRAFLWEMK